VGRLLQKGSGKPRITWPEAVDEALCFGWIDGVRKRIDDTSHRIRFTPRAGSTWSKVNVRRVADLTKRGRMRAGGVEAYKGRSAKRTGVYSFEQRQPPRLSRADQRRFKANAAAWHFFKDQSAWYQRTATWWVTSAKREETRTRRLNGLIGNCALGRRMAPFARQKTRRSQPPHSRSKTTLPHPRASPCESAAAAADRD
jgi:uncharacterized protein YdeI (YjbR/CyaY-like superfamily)